MAYLFVRVCTDTERWLYQHQLSRVFHLDDHYITYLKLDEHLSNPLNRPSPLSVCLSTNRSHYPVTA